jgi:hypothetical protein
MIAKVDILNLHFETLILKEEHGLRVFERRVLMTLYIVIQDTLQQYTHRVADKPFAKPIPYVPICSTTKRIFLDGLKKLEQ